MPTVRRAIDQTFANVAALPELTYRLAVRPAAGLIFIFVYVLHWLLVQLVAHFFPRVSPWPLSTTTSTSADQASSRVAALPEMWALIAKHSGVVGAWRLMGVCLASRKGSQKWLRSLPGLVLCGGACDGGRKRDGEFISEVWRLDLSNLQWSRMADLARGRERAASCTVRGRVVVLGGFVAGRVRRAVGTASVEIMGYNSEAGEYRVTTLPPLTCGSVFNPVVIAIDDSASDLGQVLLIARGEEHGASPALVHKVDLASGICTPQPCPRILPEDEMCMGCMAARLVDGRIVYVRSGNNSQKTTAQVWEPPAPGSLHEASWRWRALPWMSLRRCHASGLVLSDGRFAVFGGACNLNSGTVEGTFDALSLDSHDARWEQLPPMLQARHGFACEAIGGCVLVAGGTISQTVAVYEEALGRWRTLPGKLPYDNEVYWMSSALM